MKHTLFISEFAFVLGEVSMARRRLGAIQMRSGSGLIKTDQLVKAMDFISLSRFVSFKVQKTDLH